MRRSATAPSLLALACLALVAGCQPAGDDTDSAKAGQKQINVDPGADSPEPVTRAVALLHPTEGSDALGVVSFRQTDDELRVFAEMDGLPPGKHAFHVHLLGDCRKADATSAGTHFNFAGSSRNPPEDIKRITGNLGELDAGSDGTASFTGLVKGGSLQGPHAIIGRSVIVHARANDPQSPPIGAAGPRLACGVIGLTE